MVPAVDILQHALPRRLSRTEYDRLVAEGFFDGERVELIRGLVLEMSPNYPEHANPVDVLTEKLVVSLSGKARVRIQQPFLAADDSEPEPDVAVVPAGTYGTHHPSRAHLIVEVANTSLDHDLTTKAELYAESGVPEYWVVDVTTRTLHILTEPGEKGYFRRRTLAVGEAAVPRAFPDVSVPVAALFE